MTKEIKCPQCGNIGQTYLMEKCRYMFHCLFCGLNTYLKLLNMKGQ